MAGKVKPTSRPYHSLVRAEQARRTRMRILDAAEKEFAQRGYSATTMAAIARRAEVAPDTIYATFTNKRGVLGALVETRVRGSAAPVLQQSGPQAVRAETDQRRQIELFVPDIIERIGRVQSVYDVVAEAARSDPEAAALQKAMLDQRYANLDRFVGWIEANGPLRDGLGHDDATAGVWTLTSTEVFRLLRIDRGWSKARYRRWLTDCLIGLLLP
jgi:AcrR family transcriptional regulator